MSPARKNQSKLKGQMFMALAFMVGSIFLPTSTILVVGMLPTIVCFLTERSRKKNRMITVGAMNLAGCMPFLLELWSKGNSFQMAVQIIEEPMTLVIIYGAAAIGYLIDWSMVGIVANIMVQKALMRQKSIIERQEELVKRWGEEVTGEMILDSDGFPIAGNASDKK